MTRSPTQDVRQANRNDGLSRQMKRRAERNRCSACGRKDATKRIPPLAGEPTIRVCRWCGDSRVIE